MRHYIANLVLLGMTKKEHQGFDSGINKKEVIQIVFR